jgi:hypothetical protein
MTIDRSLIGSSSPAQTFEVEKEAIVRLAEAIGDPHPDYRDGSAAPPTFPTTFRMAIPGLAEIDPARILHGEQEYSYERAIRAGDRLTCVARIADVYERQGRVGTMTFVIAELEGRDDASKEVFAGRATLIIR